jgi:hypothetical protein
VPNALAAAANVVKITPLNRKTAFFTAKRGISRSEGFRSTLAGLLNLCFSQGN